MPRPLAPLVVVTAASGLAFVGWTWLTLRTDVLASWDATSLTPGVDLSTGWGQLTAACSFLFHPIVYALASVLLILWAHRRRLRNLALAFALALPLGWGSEQVLKNLFDRPRPATNVPLVTGEGFAYPSGHMIGVSVFVVLVYATVFVIRRSSTVLWAVRVGGVALWLAVAYNRWALRAHYLTDIVAGGLWGTFLASLCLAVAGVHVVDPWPFGRARVGVPPNVAIIVNPTKVPDWEHLRKHVDGAARSHGWGRPRWLETTPGDAGLDAARRAVADGADLVLVSGGDGTVRSVAQGLAGSPATMAVLPVGTGNLLARNLGIPLDLADAIDAAFDGVPHALDLVEVRADGGEPQASVVMAGVGIDAFIMGETNSDLKRAVGPAAYVVAAAGAILRPSFLLAVQVDGSAPTRREVGLALIANVGQLQGGIQLVPDARPDDGLVDLLFADAHGPAGWAGMAGQLMSGFADIGGIERGRGHDVVFEADEPMPYQIDGDSLGTCRRLEASVVPSALQVMVPA